MTYNKKTTIMMATIAVVLSLATITAVFTTISEANASASGPPTRGSGGQTSDGGSGAGRGSGGNTGNTGGSGGGCGFLCGT